MSDPGDGGRRAGRGRTIAVHGERCAMQAFAAQLPGVPVSRPVRGEQIEA
jgi:hypothetical protein